MLNSMMVRDFRSFIGRHEFAIKPITVLLGRNSSGKSTITRLLPLLQQSFELRTSAPILWNGANVDFGSVSEIRPRQITDSTIGIGFSVVPTVDMRRNLLIRRYSPRGRVFLEEEGLIGYEVNLIEQTDPLTRNERTRLAGFSLSINGDKLDMDLNEDGAVTSCKINDLDFKSSLEKAEARFDVQAFFPTIRTKKLADFTSDVYHHSLDNIDEQKTQIIGYLSHGTTSLQTKRSLALNLLYSPREHFQNHLSRNVGTEWFNERVDWYLKYSPSDIERLRLLTLLSVLPTILNALSTTMASEFAKSSYVGPTRAAGERYYRWRELAVDRLDPKGENFAMYVMALSHTERKRLSDIFEDALGYALKATQEGGHASIMVSEAGTDEWFNLADVGFGFSQILPVIAQIHASSRPARLPRSMSGSSRSDTWVMAVEQPELHLHPAFQGKIAELLASVSSPVTDESQGATRRQNRFIVETHSEALVNRLSELVSQKKLRKEDVAIYIFDKDDKSNQTNVQRVDFDESGDIAKWPYGFFKY